MQNRDVTLDVLKGLAITFMVVGHAMPGSAFNHFIQEFHMPVFFMASGFFFASNKVDSFGGLYNVMRKKIVALFVPYAIWTLFYILCNNIFIKLGLYSMDPALLSVERQKLAVEFSCRDIVVQVMKIFLLAASTEMGGAFWFVIALFQVVLLYNLIEFMSRKLRLPNRIVQTALSFMLLLVGFYVGKAHHPLFGFTRAFSCYGLYHLGRLAKYNCAEINVCRLRINGILSCGVLLIMGRYGTLALNVNDYPSPFFLLLTSCSGWFFCCYVSSIICRVHRLAAVMSFLGRHTLSILAMHLLVFKFVSYMAVKV